MGTITFVGFICSIGFLIFSLLLIITSSIILGITTDRNINAGFNNNKNIILPNSIQLIPFSPLRCPENMSQFYQTRILTYLQVTAPKDSAVTLYLHETNSTESTEISHCKVEANEQCALPIPMNNDSISAFLSLANSTDSSKNVDWGCYYINLPIITSYAVLGCSACIFLLCFCCAIICFLTCCCDEELGDHKGARFIFPQGTHHTLATTIYSRTLPTDKTPLVNQQHVETGFVDGAKVIRHYSTVGGKTNDRANENFITDDSTNS